MTDEEVSRGEVQASISEPSPASARKPKGPTPRPIREAIMAGLARGESADSLADEHGVARQTVRKWAGVTRPVPRATPIPGPTGPAPVPASDGSLLDRAMAAIGGGTPGSPPPGAPMTPAARPVNAEGLPVPTADELVALITTVDLVVMGTIIPMRYPEIRGAEFERLVKFPDMERKALVMLAPYAADYAPVVMAYMKPAMAGLFVGVWAMSVVRRFKQVEAVAEEKRPKHDAALGESKS